MQELYTSEIMSFAAHIPHIGRLEGAQGQGHARAKLCGSQISMSLNMNDGRVCEFAQEVKACLVGQASAGILGHHIVGSTRSELLETREQVRLMLENGGPAPEGKWADYALLIPVRNYKSRYSTVLIAFDAALEAVDMALAHKENQNV